MISHDFPVWDTLCAPRVPASGGAVSVGARLGSAPACVQAVWGSGYGPLRGEFHAAARLQGARVDPRCVSRSARPRRLRGSLLLSGAGPSCDRCRGQRVNGRDRGPDRAFRGVFGRARAVGPGALRDERDAQGGWRRSGGVERQPQASCRHYGCSVVCRSGSEVSDLGTRAFQERARGGHPKGARAQRRSEFPGGAQGAWSTGMMAGGDGPAVAGGPALHIPVLGPQAVGFLNVRDGGVYIDGTFGAGGYTRAILAAARCNVIAIDRDQSAIAMGADLVEEAGGRLALIEDRFS